MRVRVVACGPVSDLFSERVVECTFPATGAQIREQIEDAIPGVERYRFSVAVDESLVTGEEMVTGASEVALLPPFSGG